MLVTGNIAVRANNETDVAFKNYGPFSTCRTKNNEILKNMFDDKTNHIYFAIPT